MSEPSQTSAIAGEAIVGLTTTGVDVDPTMPDYTADHFEWEGSCWEAVTDPDLDVAMMDPSAPAAAKEALTVRQVQSMSVATKKLIVTEEAILNHATLIGQTVVDDINVQGKIVGTDGVFTGTVDFENVNVTGTQIVNKLGANSISADRIAGGSFSGQTFVGGRFQGGEFQAPADPRWNGGVAIDPKNGIRGWSTDGTLTFQLHPGTGRVKIRERLEATNDSDRGVMLIPTTSTGGGGLWFSHSGYAAGSDAAIWRSGYDPNGVEPLNIRGANGGHVSIRGGLEVTGGGASVYGPLWADGLTTGSSAVYLNNLRTTSSTGNLVISNSTKQIFHGVSSRRYKKNIVNWSPEADRVLALQPRQWQHDDPADDDIDETWYVGFIAEEVDELGLKKLVQYVVDGKGGWIPEALNYDRFAAAQQVVLQKHEAEIQELRERIALLESK